MATVTIHVDSREGPLLESLQAKLSPSPDTGIHVVSAQLEVGDIHITTENGLRLIFERKTGADLASSIKDGRYREQKRRMAVVTVAHHITYIIERLETCPLSDSVVSGMILNTMYRDGMHIMYSTDVRNTADMLLQIARKVVANPTKFQASSDGGAAGDNTAYIESLKVKSRKIDNIDVPTCYLLQLGQIPGVSTKIAEAITRVYPSMYSFTKAVNESENPVKDLCAIPLIGSKKAQAIVSYIKA
jgi:ERCC4-type nuclease